jgi:hypothetical protein
LIVNSASGSSVNRRIRVFISSTFRDLPAERVGRPGSWRGSQASRFALAARPVE